MGSHALQIRPARPSDAAAVRRLLRSLGHAEEALGHVEARLAEGHDHVLVAERAGEVVGLANAASAAPLEYARPQLRVYALVVDPTSRRSGVATALVRELEALAARSGCFRVELTSGRSLVDGHAFWRAAGYEETGGRWVRRL